MFQRARSPTGWSCCSAKIRFCCLSDLAPPLFQHANLLNKPYEDKCCCNVPVCSTRPERDVNIRFRSDVRTCAAIGQVLSARLLLIGWMSPSVWKRFHSGEFDSFVPVWVKPQHPVSPAPPVLIFSVRSVVTCLLWLWGSVRRNPTARNRRCDLG